MLYFRKYLTNSQKLFLAERWWSWLLWLKISRAQIFWFCNGNVTTFPTSRKCKNFNSSLYTVPAEKLYLHTYLTNFQKLSFGCKITNVAILVENFKGSGIWVLQWQRYTFPTSRKCKNFNSSLYTVPAEMLYFRKYLTNFLKHFFWLKEVEPVYCGKFQVRRYFGLVMATLQLFQHPENVKISILPFTPSQQKSYIFIRIWRIFKNFLLAAR